MEITIKERIQETKKAITLVLDLPPHSWHYKAGQFTTIGVTITGKKYFRSYSFSTSPGQDPYPAITIKCIRNGVVSNYLHDHIQAGSSLWCSPPQGQFTINYRPERRRHLFFIAGGSGITPIFSMIKTLLCKEPHSQLTLLYANHDQTQIIYKQALDNLVATHAQRLSVHHLLSQPKPGWQGWQGRMTASHLITLCDMFSIQPDYTYLCGPEALMKKARYTLLTLGYDPERICQESYTPLTSSARLPLEEMTAEATIYYQGDQYICSVEPGETLLDAALDIGVEIPFSCSSGICNTCRVRCTAGQVYMTEDEGLSEEEKAASYVLTCVGYPATQRLTLIVDDEEEPC